eukprot:1528471-Prorocentrum_lima.AAC.1
MMRFSAPFRHSPARAPGWDWYSQRRMAPSCPRPHKISALGLHPLSANWVSSLAMERRPHGGTN